jgi:hypothetical protein
MIAALRFVALALGPLSTARQAELKKQKEIFGIGAPVEKA